MLRWHNSWYLYDQVGDIEIIRVRRCAKRCDLRRIWAHLRIHSREVSLALPSPVWHDLFTSVTWRIHVCSMTLFTCATWLIQMCDMTRYYTSLLTPSVSCTSFPCVQGRTHIYDMIHPHDLQHIACGVFMWMNCVTDVSASVLNPKP